jgi:hypothetical protein
MRGSGEKETTVEVAPSLERPSGYLDESERRGKQRSGSWVDQGRSIMYIDVVGCLTLKMDEEREGVLRAEIFATVLEQWLTKWMRGKNRRYLDLDGA